MKQPNLATIDKLIPDGNGNYLKYYTNDREFMQDNDILSPTYKAEVVYHPEPQHALIKYVRRE